ncbi:hypothetical protein O0L34_g4968 [Tuta absoluta]|nr:hypothetical protein O0L34_g4968 [Tuta absoluta]
MGKAIPPMGGIPVQNEPPPGYRGRYDGPPQGPPHGLPHGPPHGASHGPPHGPPRGPPFDGPPGVEPPVPGFEPSPFEKPPFVPPGHMDRERLPPSNFRDPYRAPFVEAPGPGYRDMPVPAVPAEIPVLVGEPPRFRDNYRPGHPYREQGAPPFRDGQPFRDSGPQPPYRDGPSGPPREFRGPPGSYRDSSYRGHPYRESGFRDNPPHNFREGAPPFRPPSADPREPIPPNYDPNYRDGFRDENAREHGRSSRYPPSRSRGAPRPPVEHERHRDGRERERFEPSDRERLRENKRGAYEKGREPREDRPRDYDRVRDYEKDRERDYDRSTPDKKIRASPKRSRDVRERKRSESRGRSKDRDRESKRDKKEDRIRDKSTDKNKDKEKKEKPKDRKKKKREKEKDTEKKKKRDKKEKKEKDGVKREDDDAEKSESKDDEKLCDSNDPKPELKQQVIVKLEKTESQVKLEAPEQKKEIEPPKATEAKEESLPPPNDLYDDEEAEAVDKEIMQNYVKAEEPETVALNTESTAALKDEPFDGIELQANADELDLKAEMESTAPSKEMLAPLPALSKWEVDEDNVERMKEPGEITSPDEEEDGGKVTSEVLKRAENAIFAKAISSLRPIEIKKLNSERAKLYSDEHQPKSSIQITVPVVESESRPIELNEKKKRHSKTPPPRLSVKERLGGKVDDRRIRDGRVVHSTVERVKSRSKTPKKEQPYRRVTVDKERSRKLEVNRLEVSAKGDRRVVSEAVKPDKNHDRIEFKDTRKKIDSEKKHKEHKSKSSESDARGNEKNISSKNQSDRERKKSVLDEANFEPDYDETVESDNEAKDDTKKRERSTSPSGGLSEAKKPKVENETIKLDLANVKKKPDTESESSSSDSSSSSSSDDRKRKKKKKKNKKKKKRAASDSESDSGSSSDGHKKKKKKHKHKKKSSKKKKKSKHK